MNHERLKGVSAAILASSLTFGAFNEVLGSYEEEAIVVKPNTINLEYERQKRAQEQERIERVYKTPLGAISEFINIDSEESITQLYKKISSNPSMYIEIVDDQLYFDHGFRDAYTYFIYPDEKDDDIDNKLWSIIVVVQNSIDTPPVTTVGLRLDKDLKLFMGDKSTLNNDKPNPTQLQEKSDKTFKIPKIMERGVWIKYDESNIYQRAFIDPYFGIEFKQTLTPQNTIYYSTLYIPNTGVMEMINQRYEDFTD